MFTPLSITVFSLYILPYFPVVGCRSEIQVLIKPRAMVAEVDEEKDATIDYTEVKAEPLAEIRF